MKLVGAHDPRARVFNGKVLRLAPQIPCIHLGDDLHANAKCKQCGGAPMWSCRRHGRCLPSSSFAVPVDDGTGLPLPVLCAQCDDYQPKGEGEA